MLKKRILNILFWSVVSAAFIGPGTVTTAAMSGSKFGYQLLWTLLFSTLACFLLQEASARITIHTGRNIGEIMKDHFSGTITGKLILILIALAICGGAAAYQTGNILGAREGLLLFTGGNPVVYTLVPGMLAGIILMIPSLKLIARIMGILVITLGITFLYTAFRLNPDPSEFFKGLFIPSFPIGSTAPLLILGLIGTTIVPYNIFLGSGLGTQNKDVKEMRLGLFTAIILGGIFSMAVVIVGAAVHGEFSFRALADALGRTNNIPGKFLLGTGLFAAGFTSSITAPLASAITLKSLFGNESEKWQNNGLYFRGSALIVLFTGLGFAVFNMKPVPAIIFAQALNGFILPFISFFLVWALKRYTNTSGINFILLGFTLVITLLMGLKNLTNALGINQIFLSGSGHSLTLMVLSILITFVFFRLIKRS